MKKQTLQFLKKPANAEERDTIIGKALSARMTNGRKSDETCVSVEEIAAFVDGSLSEANRNRIMGHLAVCIRCYQIFSMSSELQKTEQQSPELVGAGRYSKWYVVSGMLAVAAVAVLVIRLTVQSPHEQQNVAQQTKPTVPQVATVPVPGSVPIDSPSPKPVVASRQQPTKPSGTAIQLLTDEEAAMGESKSFGYAADLHKDGPSIKILQPEISKELQPPFKLFVKFVPKGGNPVDLATLKVEAIKIINVDLTSRVKPYASSEGISMDKADIPAGNHKIRVTIGDVNGGITQEIFVMKVL